MAFQYSVTVRDDKLDSFETTVGTSARMKIFTGAQPADCATADSGTLLADLSLPTDWMAAASSGTKAKSGTWEDTSADGTGTAGHFRIYESTATTCHAQGSITITSGGGDMEVDNTSFATGQSFTVTTFTITAGNA
jgi:hypothetical protein